MQELKAIVNLLSRQKLKQIEIITEDVQLSEKSKDLFEGIKSGTYNSDEEAALALYDSNKNNESYRKLKYRLRERLINTLFFIDIQNYSKHAYEKALNRNYKHWASAKILMEKGLRGPAMSLLENSLKSVIKFDITDLTVLILKALKMHYGLYQFNAYKYNKYKEQYKQYKDIFDYEEQAEEYYTLLGHIVSSTKAYSYNAEMKQMDLELSSFIEKIKSIDAYYLQYYALNAFYFMNLIKKDNQKVLEICNYAIDYFENKQGFSRMAIFSFYQKKGISLLGLQQYPEAIENFEKCLSFNPPEGGLSWQYIYSYMFTANILLKDYQAAYRITSFIMNHKKFNSLNETFRQPWHLKEAFIHFLIKVGEINPDAEEGVKPLRTFRIGRFLNDVDKFARDKRGLNITINIIQMLFLIIDEKYDDVLDKLAALKQYNFRYLKRPEYARSSNFIKMLLKIPEANYEPDLIRSKAAKFYDNLVSHTSDFSEQSMSIEIIPYEQLWKEILSIFEK
ncbi:MAG: hypothetical protein KJO50_01765 [Bacteroidia bacterium]|nr:hypothetical protein [Bacteroidia bacterium]